MTSTWHIDYYNSQEAENYYTVASDWNEGFLNSLEYKEISSYIHSWDSICEFWCGEGSKVAVFSEKKDTKLFGIDISKFAIQKAKEQYPMIDFQVMDIAHTHFADATFDLTLTCFVLEHVTDPRVIIDEMVRTTRKDWYIVLWFPNYGSPLFPSPPTLYGKSFFQKVCIIWIRILSTWFTKTPVYKNVEPILDAEFQLDYDTISEIYMWSLMRHLREQWLKIEFASSRWENINSGSNPIFRFYLPFKLFKNWLCKYWGPQCFVVIKR
jgi:SAM-dependent methyltransferase